MRDQGSIGNLYQLAGISNGSTDMSRELYLGSAQRLIAIENVGMMTGDLFIRSAPSETVARKRDVKRIRPNVVESIERSLDRHADVWANLAKL